MTMLSRLLCGWALLAALPAFGNLLDQPRGNNSFLPVDEAFRFDALALSADEIEARWDIAPGYYLYKQRLDIQLQPQDGVSLSWSAPDGQPYEDEHFGSVEIFHDVLSIPLQLSGASGTVSVRFRYQGCAEAGLCYPPVTRTLDIALPEYK